MTRFCTLVEREFNLHIVECCVSVQDECTTQFKGLCVSCFVPKVIFIAIGNMILASCNPNFIFDVLPMEIPVHLT